MFWFFFSFVFCAVEVGSALRVPESDIIRIRPEQVRINNPQKVGSFRPDEVQAVLEGRFVSSEVILSAADAKMVGQFLQLISH